MCVFTFKISAFVCVCVLNRCIMCVSQVSPIAETISNSSSSSSRKKSVLMSTNCHSPNTGQGQSPSNSSLVSVSVCEGYSVYVLNLEALLKLDSVSCTVSKYSHILSYCVYRSTFKLQTLLLPQIKVNLSTREQGTAAGEGSEEERGAGLGATSDSGNMQAVEELKRAFELVEAANPGLSDLLLNRIVLHLKQWYV